LRTWRGNTENLGAKPLWEGYAAVENYTKSTVSARSSNQVRTSADIGPLYASVVMEKKPRLIVEFGTAFGVSGMYWLAGLQANGSGQLFTFEPNEIWANIARDNLSRISDRYRLTIGTFEDNCSIIDNGDDKIDIAFIDAIHTSEFVLHQLDLVERRCAPGALIFLDDINFSADMLACWKTVSARPHYAAVADIGGHVGVIELAKA
jgi:predicted O-methyltransferase YrrM